MRRTAAAAALLAAGALLYFADPASTPLYPPCLIRTYTGWRCPGCGATRAMHALLHGRVREAWEWNALWTAGAPAAAAWGAWRLLRDVRRARS